MRLKRLTLVDHCQHRLTHGLGAADAFLSAAYFDNASPPAQRVAQSPCQPVRKAARLAALARNANSAPAPSASTIARVRPLVYPPVETGRG
jgi:hypothetical protein